jgi:hypothetical protein
MADTPNHEYNVPQQGTQDWHNPLNENFEAFEVDIELRDTEANLGGYQPTDGAKFLATDTGVVYTGDGTTWVPQFILPDYDDSADEVQFGRPLVAPELDLGTLRGSITEGTPLTTIAGNNLTIDSNGQLNASTGGGGGGGGISSLNGGDGISPDSISDGDTLAVAWGDAGTLDSDGNVDDWSGAADLDASGSLTLSVVQSLSGGDGVAPGSIGDGDTLSVAWGDANDLDGDGNLTGGNWTVNSDLLAPSDSSIAGIDVDEVNASAVRAGSDPLTLTVDGARVLSLGAETNGDAGNVIAGSSDNGAPSGVIGATIGGGGRSGDPNEVTGDFATIAGGLANESDATDTVGGGFENTAAGGFSTVAGGEANEISGLHATIAGGQDNTVIGDKAAVTGGRSNTVDGTAATIGGGSDNVVFRDYGTIAGGGPTDNSDPENTSNEVTDRYGTVGGGGNNQAGSDPDSSDSADFATVAGGESNTATGAHAAIGGGQGNQASGSNATVPGGSSNQASGTNSFAGGNRAKATNDGTFVWADDASDDVFSNADNAFLVEASGGTGIGTTDPQTTFHIRDSVAESGGDNIGRHVAAIQNTSTSSNPVPDVLGLELTNVTDPGGFNSYISFMDDSGTIGNIQGDGNGGVEFTGSTADFAECFPKADPEQEFEDGTVVGLRDGEVVALTEEIEPDTVLVVSTAPLMTGNRPIDEGDRNDYVKLSLVGQVPVRVSESVTAGDVLVASQNNDGTAVGRADCDASDRPIVGLALEDCAAGDQARALVGGPGLDTGLADRTTRSAADGMNRTQNERLDALEAENEELKQEIAEKDQQISDLEAENEQLRERLAAVEEHLATLDSGGAAPATADD